MKVGKLKRPSSLRDQVYEALRSALFGGRFEPGERVTEETVADMLGVSRTPVREAINRLAQQGVLEARNGGGFLFPSPTAKEIENVFELRRLLEPYAAGKATQFCADGDIEFLEGIIARQEALMDSDDSTRFFAHTLEFRSRVFDLAGNPRMRRVIDQFMDHLHFIGILTLKDRAVRKLVVAGHKRILAALKARDGERVQTAVRAHLDAAEESLKKAVKLHIQA